MCYVLCACARASTVDEERVEALKACSLPVVLDRDDVKVLQEREVVQVAGRKEHLQVRKGPLLGRSLMMWLHQPFSSAPTGNRWHLLESWHR